MRWFELTETAELDVYEIWQFISDGSPRAADRWIRHLYTRFAGLVDLPQAGKSREDLAPGVRSVPFGRYLIFYRVIDDQVRIVRVVAGDRDLRRLSFDG